MDNVTHAIAGVLAAEAVVQLRRGLGVTPSPAWARTAWLVSALAHNLADADVVYAGITGGPLGYLLHHRGHTHTLALAPLLALLAVAPAAWWAHRRRPGLSRRDWGWLGALAIAGPVGHVALDLSNDYGVHPLWPLSNAWLYGDAVFIVEPLFWACTIPVVAAATRWRPGRWLWGAVLAAGLVLAWAVDLVPRGGALVSTALAIVSVAVAWRAGPPRRVAYGLGASALVLAAFLAGSRAARSVAREAADAAWPGWRTLDAARSPLPGTPVCWQVVLVQRDKVAEAYALRLLRASAWPSVIPARACGGGDGSETTAPLSTTPVEPPGVLVLGTLEAPLGGLRARAERCDVAAYLRWARAPFFAPGGDGFVVGDLRYDRGGGSDFAELRLPRRVEACLAFVPPWRPPRADLLEP